LEANGDRPLVVGAAALEDLRSAHQAVLAGDREVGGEMVALMPLLAATEAESADPVGVDIEAEEVLDLGDWDTGEFLDLTEGQEDPQEDLGDAAVTPPEGMISVVTSAVEKAAAKVSRPVARSGNKLIRVELERLQELQHLVGELLIQQNRQSLQDEQLQASLKSFRSRLQKHRRLLGELRDRTRALGVTHDALGAKGEALDRLGKGRRGLANRDLVDQGLVDLMDATVAEAEHLEDTVEVVERYSQQTTETTDKQRRLLGSVRDSLMDTRMQPISSVFQRFPPLVRQMVSRYGKSVELRLLGERVAIDKTAIEELYDPLLHLVRNAFDHGIESAAERRAAGKTDTGIIQLQALQQGNQVLIIVSDDGGGIDPEKVRRKAQSRQLRDPAVLARMEPAELFELLFEPGFSTAEQVSDLSGRGVGLDVVKS
ncbi:MAG: ATP-binding protein, partial [Cyanobacteria bacterium P01_H01_bin.130]